MEGHQCKLCGRSFRSGKALGGHMRSHLSPLPVPPRQPPQLDGDESSSSLFSFSEEELIESSEGKDLTYGLRENPKKSFKLVDPEFLENELAVAVLQDRESETESTQKPTRKPTRKRSRRTQKMGLVAELEKSKLKKPSSTELVTELELSSISDTSPEDEDVALCLMMLSRDTWGSKQPSQTRDRYQCETCKKVFGSFQALGGHRTSHKKIKSWDELENQVEAESLEQKPRKQRVGKKNASDQVHECPICFRVFGSGQALGGHKRTHFLGSSSTPSTASTSSSTTPKPLEVIGESLVMEKKDEDFGLKLIDLNLPAPMEDEDFGLVFAFSEAC